MLNNANTFPRTEFSNIMYMEKELLHFVRNKKCSFMKLIARTILTSISQPRAALLRRLPWASVYRPFRTKNSISIILIQQKVSNSGTRKETAVNRHGNAGYKSSVPVVNQPVHAAN